MIREQMTIQQLPGKGSIITALHPSPPQGENRQCSPDMRNEVLIILPLVLGWSRWLIERGFQRWKWKIIQKTTMSWYLWLCMVAAVMFVSCHLKIKFSYEWSIYCFYLWQKQLIYTVCSLKDVLWVSILFVSLAPLHRCQPDWFMSYFLSMSVSVFFHLRLSFESLDLGQKTLPMWTQSWTDKRGIHSLASCQLEH